MYPGTQPSMEIPILSGSVSVSESGLDSQLDTDTDPDTDPDGNDGLFPSKHEHDDEQGHDAFRDLTFDPPEI
jgi:hypothetical protein